MTMYQPIAAEVTRLLSAPRLTSYQRTPISTRADTLSLYAWNIEISGAFFIGVHYLEVALRNHLDMNLTRWSATEVPDIPWFLRGDLPFQKHPGMRRQVTRALHYARGDGTHPETVRPERVLTELSLGFWWSAFAELHNRTLWQPCLRAAFPRAQRAQLHQAIDRVRILRNRISHHEPIHHWDLNDEYQNLITTATHISPALGWWIDSTSTVQSVLLNRPRP